MVLPQDLAQLRARGFDRDVIRSHQQTAHQEAVAVIRKRPPCSFITEVGQPRGVWGGGRVGGEGGCSCVEGGKEAVFGEEMMLWGPTVSGLDCGGAWWVRSK
jgi:hypothetical protein